MCTYRDDLDQERRDEWRLCQIGRHENRNVSGGVDWEPSWQRGASRRPLAVINMPQ